MVPSTPFLPFYLSRDLLDSRFYSAVRGDHMNLGDFTEGRGGSSKTATEGCARSSKTLELRAHILTLLADNNRDHFENPHNFNLAQDIAEELDISKSTASYHIKQLREEGYIQENEKKSKFYRSYTLGNAKIYNVTRKGAKFCKKHGGPREKFENITGGPQKFELENLHGDLVFKYEVHSCPNSDPLTWDKVNEMNNGTIHKIKTLIGPSGQKATIELYEGKESATLTMKPRLEGVDPDELVESMNELAWGIYSDIQKNGYEVSMPDRTGEGKFTIVSDKLPDEFKEGENFLIDHSEGEKELHPRTGDFESNLEMTKYLNDAGHMAKAAQKIEEVADREDHEELKKQVDKQAQVILQQREAIKSLSDQVGTMSESISELSNALNEALDGSEQQYEPPEMDNGGHIYG